MRQIGLEDESPFDILDEMFNEVKDTDSDVFESEDIDLDLEDSKMIQLEPGTVLEREYKGKDIKVKVLKDGALAFNGKQYENRGDLMKAIGKGKTMQFTTFFGLNKGEDTNGEDKPRKKRAKVSDDDNVEEIEIPDNLIVINLNALNSYIDERIRKFFVKD